MGHLSKTRLRLKTIAAALSPRIDLIMTPYFTAEVSSLLMEGLTRRAETATLRAESRPRPESLG